VVSIIVALIAALQVIITTSITNKTNKKVDKIDNLKTDFKEQIDNIKKENDKTYLTDFLSELENGESKSEIQIKRAYEIYEEYRSLHGNSYITSKWIELQKEGVL